MPRLAFAGLILAAALEGGAFEVSAVGDLYLWQEGMEALRGRLEARGLDEGAVAAWPFEKVKPHFSGAVFGNLESPITEAPLWRFKPFWMRWYFRQPPGITEATLRAAGFHVLSLANNHASDAGAAGIKDTRRALKNAGLRFLGAGLGEAQAGRPLEFGGATWLAFNDIGPPGTFAGKRSAGARRYRRAEALKLAKAAKKPLVVSLHWGQERRRDYPVAPPRRGQVKQARALVEAGASLILGHHTHAVSHFEEWEEGLIAYSLGNFLFSVNSDSQRERSVILKASFEEGRLRRWTLVPVWNGVETANFQVEPMAENPGRRFLRDLGAKGRRYINFYDEHAQEKRP